MIGGEKGVLGVDLVKGDWILEQLLRAIMRRERRDFREGGFNYWNFEDLIWKELIIVCFEILEGTVAIWFILIFSLRIIALSKLDLSRLS